MTPRADPSKALAPRLYERMRAAAGPFNWWPRDHDGPNGGRDEIIIGAILTQNAAWRNVEQALANLRGADLLDLAKLARRRPERIAPLIQPARYFNVKARRLVAVAGFFAPGGRGRFEDLARMSDEQLREALLEVHGVGPETADSILLYALGRPSFVIDAYTLRIGRRHGLFGEKTTYDEARRWFSAHLRPEVELYNDYHAQLVHIGHHFCKPRARCADCPLARRDCAATPASWRWIQSHAASDM